MVYHKWSLVGFMLWLRYALGMGNPFVSLAHIYSNYLESPGTKAFTKEQCNELFPDAINLNASIQLTHGDLLESQAGQRHKGIILSMVRFIWPRWYLRRFARDYGLFLLLGGEKPGL
jgi:hypothetical protein